MFLITAIVLIVLAYFSMTTYLVASVLLYAFFQIIGGKNDGASKRLRLGGFIGWLISIPFCLVMVYLNAGT
jgi:bacteriorhodopsin